MFHAGSARSQTDGRPLRRGGCCLALEIHDLHTDRQISRQRVEQTFQINISISRQQAFAACGVDHLLGREMRASRCIANLRVVQQFTSCLLYTSDAADDLLCVDLGGPRTIKKKKNKP